MIGLGSKLPPPRPTQFESCQHCGGYLLRADSFLHIATGKTIRVFKCTDCKKLTWDD